MESDEFDVVSMAKAVVAMPRDGDDDAERLQHLSGLAAP